MEEEICIKCNKYNDNNINTHCKFCNEPLCKNIWEIKHDISTTIILKMNFIIEDFENFCLPPDYDNNTYKTKYKFYCYKTKIFFDKKKLCFCIKDLYKPLYIKFKDIYSFEIKQKKYFYNYCSMIIKLNSIIIEIYENNINLLLFNILDKFLNTKTVSKPDIIVKT